MIRLSEPDGSQTEGRNLDRCWSFGEEDVGKHVNANSTQLLKDAHNRHLTIGDKMRTLRLLALLLIIASITTATSADAKARFDSKNGIDISGQREIAYPLLAQASTAPATAVNNSYHDGLIRGEMSASASHSTGASLAGGLIWGFGLGIVGTGIGYFTTGTSDPSARDMIGIEDKGPDFREGYINGYRDKARSKNKSAKLGGGLLGTLFFVAVVLG